MNEQNVYHPTLTIRTIFSLSVIATFLLIGFSIFYYFVIFLPGKENTLIQQEETRQQNINICLKRAYDMYKNKWNSNCELEGLEADCKLPKSRSEDVSAYHKDLKDECYKRYP